MINFKQFINEKTTLEYHDKLNPLLWTGFSLKRVVKNKLLHLASEWQKFAKIPDNIITDIIFTGGNANFNYTETSDIDVHIIINKNSMFADREFLDEYLKDKKLLWSLVRHNKVKGYTVEFYAQDYTDKLAASAIYSLKTNKWIKQPVHGNYNFEDEGLEKKVEYFRNLIDTFIEKGVDKGEFDVVKSKLKDLRVSSLHSDDGEYSEGNLIFKSLRGEGYLDRMNTYLNKIKDRELSLD
jgi:predicted nucleotidyltransferase